MANTGSPELVNRDLKKAVDDLKEFKANFKVSSLQLNLSCFKVRK